MRVLFVALQDKTLFFPMVPLAWALRSAGHEVRVASLPALSGTVTESGLTAVPVGRGIDPRRTLELTPGLIAEMHQGMPEPYDTVAAPAGATWPGMRDGYAEIVESAHRPENFPLIGGLVEFARHWRPHLVVWEPFAYAGPIAAKACGAAHARLLFGIDAFGVARQTFLRLKDEQPPDRREDPLADWLGGYARKYGSEFSEDMTVGHFTLDQLPASLQIEAPNLHYERMRYIPYGGPASVPKWLWKPPGKPRVALTLGLAATETFGGYALNLQDVLDHVGELDVEVVATLADGAGVGVGRIPSNTRVVPYVPLHALAPTCDAIIHHAGAGTLLTTSLYEVPQLAVPHHFDEPLIARKLAGHGTGLEIPADRATGRAVRDALVRLLDEPRFTQRAAALAAEIRALPAPDALVSPLEALTAEHRSR